jgi:DNA processing protein
MANDRRMEEEMVYRLALTKVSGVGPVFARKLIRQFGEAKPVFAAGQRELEKICGESRAKSITTFKGFREAEKELSFLDKYAMRPLFITDKGYPRRLLDHDDMPILLFYKGCADLNAARIVAVVGTRSPTQYGKQVTQKIIQELAQAIPDPAAPQQIMIVSGLAHGIDAIAHQAALDHSLPTIGILGHGLDRIYPSQNAPLAKKMILHGGLLTKFNINTTPEYHNFPARNRMVAALSDALIVIETDVRGGSMLTVKDALDYKKKIFALPGRITDPRSAGCNALIRSGKAKLLVNGGQLLHDLKWEPPTTRQRTAQPGLFTAPSDESNLSDPERMVLRLMKQRKTLLFDELHTAFVNGPAPGPVAGPGAGHSLDPGSSPSPHLAAGELPMILLTLELKGWISTQPGRIYRLRE